MSGCGCPASRVAVDSAESSMFEFADMVEGAFEESFERAVDAFGLRRAFGSNFGSVGFCSIESDAADFRDCCGPDDVKTEP